MSSDIQPIKQNLPEYTPEQLALISNVIAKGATPDELKLFLYRCQNLGLDPLKPGLIHFIKYGNSPGTIVVGIDGFRARANRTGKLTGIIRGVIRDSAGKCTGAWAEVYRRDWTHPAKEEVSLVEYNTHKAMWAKMPETMIKKVAEAAALRMAFPDELGGVYATEEMDQATPHKEIEKEVARVTHKEPEAEASPSAGPGSYVIKVGKKYVGKKLSEVPANLLFDYAEWLEKQENLSADAEEFLLKVDEFLAETPPDHN